jgi:hypothetical protein
MTILKNIQNFLDQSIFHYDLIDVALLKDFRLYAIRIFITNPDELEATRNFIVIEDLNGLHCVEFFQDVFEALERLENWTEKLEGGEVTVQELAFPNIFPCKEYKLRPLSDKFKKIRSTTAKLKTSKLE